MPKRLLWCLLGLFALGLVVGYWALTSADSTGRLLAAMKPRTVHRQFSGDSVQLTYRYPASDFDAIRAALVKHLETERGFNRENATDHDRALMWRSEEDTVSVWLTTEEVDGFGRMCAVDIKRRSTWLERLAQRFFGG